jgi:dihydropteroate synthase
LGADALACGGKTLDLRTPQIMGVLNITPDSFSDGGELYKDKSIDWTALMVRAEQMLGEGASMLDVGGESTRPGAAAVSEGEQADRVLPVVEKLHDELDVVISVDTSNPRIMSEAARLGAGFINDVRALRAPGALEAAAGSGLPVCLMHIGGTGEPETMQQGIDHAAGAEGQRPSIHAVHSVHAVHAGSVIDEVNAFLNERVDAAVEAGVRREQIVLDPGFGFGKRDADNLCLVNGMDQIGDGKMPLLLGVSRKSTIGRLLGCEDTKDRLVGGLMLAMRAAQRGVHIIRTHDVGATAHMLKMGRLLGGA